MILAWPDPEVEKKGNRHLFQVLQYLFILSIEREGEEERETNAIMILAV